MSTDSSILSDDEIQAALAEVESLAIGEKGGIPSLDDGRGSTPVVTVAVSRPDVDLDRQASPDSGKPVATSTLPPAPPRAATAVVPPAPSTKKASPGEAAPERATRAEEEADKDDRAEDSAPPLPKSRLAALLTIGGRCVYSALDLMLTVIDWPLARARPQTRALVGLLAIITIVTSIVAGSLLPALVPRGGAVRFLAQKTAELQLTQPAEPSTTPP
ncbi:MAG: hypothetical protein KKB50_02105 [Planctomycetes bacterium]|nr:hypothetical protein [Planctomycetota bacterium]